MTAAWGKQQIEVIHTEYNVKVLYLASYNVNVTHPEHMNASR